MAGNGDEREVHLADGIDPRPDDGVTRTVNKAKTSVEIYLIVVLVLLVSMLVVLTISAIAVVKKLRGKKPETGRDEESGRNGRSVDEKANDDSAQVNQNQENEAEGNRPPINQKQEETREETAESGPLLKLINEHHAHQRETPERSPHINEQVYAYHRERVKKSHP